MPRRVQEDADSDKAIEHLVHILVKETVAPEPNVLERALKANIKRSRNTPALSRDRGWGHYITRCIDIYMHNRTGKNGDKD